MWQGTPAAGGIVQRAGTLGDTLGLGRAVGCTWGRGELHAWRGHSWVVAAPVTPRRLSPAEPSPGGAPPRAASVRERAQRFTPAGPAGAGGAGGRAGPGQWQLGPRTAPPGPAQNARGGGAEQRPVPAPVPAGPRPGPDGMKTYFTIEIKDGRVQPLTPRVVAAPGSQRAGGHRAGAALGGNGTG